MLYVWLYNIKGQARHCPDINQVKQHFEANCDIDLQILPGDFICTQCYNAHLYILHQGLHMSHDRDLEELVKNYPKPKADGNERENSIEMAAHHVIRAVGNVLIRKLAVLFPDVYTTFIMEMMKALKLPKDEMDTLRSEMPRKWVFSRLVNFFGHHLQYVCKLRSCGVLLYQRGTDAEVCQTKSLKILGLSFLALASDCESDKGIASCTLENVCSKIMTLCTPRLPLLSKMMLYPHMLYSPLPRGPTT